MRANSFSAEQGLKALFLFVTLVFVAACSQPPMANHKLTGPTMGTVWTVQLANVPEGMTAEEVKEGVEERLALVNAQMSTYDPKSSISLYNTAAKGTWHEIPKEFAYVLDAALELAEISQGAFDPTIGPLVNLWGFGPTARGEEIPSEDTIAQVQKRIGWQRVERRAKGNEIYQPGGVYLDLSAIAKGYAVDLVGEYLTEIGVQGWLVDIGGDLRTYGRKANGELWHIAVERPQPGQREATSVLALGDKAVATSGDYRNFYATEEGQFSHTVDPRTGKPVAHGLASVTVLHESCMIADGLATLLTVLGPEEGLRFAEQEGLEVLLIVRDKTTEAFEQASTPSFEQHLKEEN